MKPFISTLYFLFSILISLGILFLLFALVQYYPWQPTEKANLFEVVLGWMTGGYVFPASVLASIIVVIHYAITKLQKKTFSFRFSLGLASLNIILYLVWMFFTYWNVIPQIPWGFY
ncbi:MAG: hypothetical protein H6556_07365 [Lewinellaceae bacterium]|nr:hypothetical protein [Lewinellaceae bacterium]